MRQRLLGDVLANPMLDGPRLVLADFLIEEGDLQGELIIVQCAIARGADTQAMRDHEKSLLSLYGEQWLAKSGLSLAEGIFSRGLIEAVTLDVNRALEIADKISDLPLREIELKVDLGGNEDELLALMPWLGHKSANLQRCRINRSRHWDTNMWDDCIEVMGEACLLRIEIGEPSGTRPIVTLLGKVLERRYELTSVEIGLWPRGTVVVDDLIEVLCIYGTRLQSLRLHFNDDTGLDWMRWIRCGNLTRLLASCLRLRTLSLPMAELYIDHFEHRQLVELELNWLGGTPLGPKEVEGCRPPARGPGLEFLRDACLPELRRLAIDLQMNWYASWTSADIDAIFAGPLPKLQHLELLYGADGDRICRALTSSPYARQLKVVDLTGCYIGEEGLVDLIFGKEALARLQRLILLRPLDVDESVWAEIQRTFPVEEPD